MNIELPLGFDYTPPDFEDMAKWSKSAAEKRQKQNQERTLAIVSGVELENGLERMLQDFFVESPESERFIKKLLGNLNSLIEITYCLGLISQDEYLDLHIIRQIRNHFAHSEDGSSFSEEKTASLCKKLRIPKQRPDLFDTLPDVEKFDATVFVLKENLITRCWNGKKHKRKIPDEINSDDWAIYFKK